MQTILLSAFFAGLVAVIVTMAIEKWGGIVGGVLETVPTTIIPATIGIYLEAGPDGLATSMSLVSFGMYVTERSFHWNLDLLSLKKAKCFRN